MSTRNDRGGTSRILTLVFTDLADSTALKTQRGDQAVGELITRHRGTEDLEAWSLYELALQSLDRLGSKDLAEARGLFERAVALDPQFATALGQLALTHLWEVGTGSADAPDEKVDAALNPSMPEAWLWRGWIQIIAGDPDAGIASSERARRLSPQGPTVAQVEDNLALAYFESGRSAEALEAGRKLVALRPAYVWGYGYVAMSAAALGRFDEARAAVSEARRVEPRVSLQLFQRGIGVSRPEIDARRNAALRQAGLE